ncbi:MAG: hypothetical protein U1F98_06870 [Verrucomicrobiota bacterium]
MAGNDPALEAYSVRVRVSFAECRSRYLADTNNPDLAWQLGRACFQLTTIATNKSERAGVAKLGIDACQGLISRNTNSLQGHYYLGANLGRLADTRRNLSGLKLVDQMEREFLISLSLGSNYDYAGPDRNLGLLYFQAPAIFSVGNRSKAQHHLLRAVKIAPEYPDNLLNYIEALIKWNERDAARKELKVLEARWPEAQKQFGGDDWLYDRLDWEERFDAVRKKLAPPPKAGDKSGKSN